MSDLLQYFQTRRQSMIDLLTELVNHESGTRDKALVDKLGNLFEQKFKALSASSVERFPRSDVGDFLLAKWNENAPGKPIMFLIHIDTVWPAGTLAERPVRIEDDKLYGPGAIDMKGGHTVMLSALEGLRDRGEMPNRPIWCLMTTDEEVGSVHSEELILSIAKEVGLVLVMEPATIDEALKTSRKGVATFDLYIEGRASHAGNAPEKGINAVVEAAHQILALQAMNDYKNGTSVSPTVISGGVTSNVIADKAHLVVDTRTIRGAAYEELKERILALQPSLPGAKLRIEPGHSRGPMERNAQMDKDFAQVKTIGEKHGLRVTEDSSGGGSDGNFTAHMGIPTLDGLGPAGDGLHAVHEHVQLASLPRRAALIAAMLKEWEF
jgi:glutamate carboxypeptidase